MKEYEVGKTRRNRLGACTELKRRMSKLCGVSNWFRVEKDSEEKSPKSSRGGRREDQAKLGPERPLEAMMFVPCTEGASIKKFLQEEGKLIGYGKVKYVESSGRTIADMLMKKDPWEGDCCRENASHAHLETLDNACSKEAPIG